MTESIEHALEYVLGSVLFCMAVILLLRLHGRFLEQMYIFGEQPEQLILFEQKGEDGWRR